MRRLVVLVLSIPCALASFACQPARYAAPRHPEPAYAPALPPAAPSPYSTTGSFSASEPPQPVIAERAAQSPVPATEAAGPATRLRRIKELRDLGLITPEEYAARRRLIIDAL